jgi:4,5-DOPA dioxygenase extradiol
VSQYNSQDVDLHYRLGQAVSALRDENIVIIGAGMSVHNLRDFRLAYGLPQPLPYVASFDEALKPAMEAPPSERQARLAEVAKRPDAHQAHPVSSDSALGPLVLSSTVQGILIRLVKRFDHLMPAYIAAGAASEDRGTRTWTHHEASLGWAMYRFGDVPA